MINKDKINLQLTITKEDLKRLEEIKKTLSKRFNMELTKSQTIQFLINKFKLENEESKPIFKESSKPIINEPKLKGITGTSTEKTRQESKRKLLLLRDTLKISNKELSDLLNINFESMRKYLQGKREPQGANAQKLEEIYKKYGII